MYSAFPTLNWPLDLDSRRFWHKFMFSETISFKSHSLGIFSGQGPLTLESLSFLKRQQIIWVTNSNLTMSRHSHNLQSPWEEMSDSGSFWHSQQGSFCDLTCESHLFCWPCLNYSPHVYIDREWYEHASLVFIIVYRGIDFPRYSLKEALTSHLRSRLCSSAQSRKDRNLVRPGKFLVKWLIYGNSNHIKATHNCLGSLPPSWNGLVWCMYVCQLSRFWAEQLTQRIKDNATWKEQTHPQTSTVYYRLQKRKLTTGFCTMDTLAPNAVFSRWTFFPFWSLCLHLSGIFALFSQSSSELSVIRI